VTENEDPRGPLREGEVVLLRRREGESHILPLRSEPQVLPGLGVFALGSAIGQREGIELTVAGRAYRVLRPRPKDYLAHLRRRSQIITPKDGQYLLYLAGVRPGDQVLEAGTGSGSLTVLLALAVGETGRVVSYDRRPDHLEFARTNLERFGLLSRVDLRQKDVSEGFEEQDADAVLLDLPEPWRVTRAAWEALRLGGHLTTYTPTYNQLEQSVRALRSQGFEEIRALELLERNLHVGDGGTRPEFDMLGHTGFLASGRKVG
jgi:tRNA (adenine57-N1/adenine58-N1)-methyltransferase